MPARRSRAKLKGAAPPYRGLAPDRWSGTRSEHVSGDGVPGDVRIATGEADSNDGADGPRRSGLSTGISWRRRSTSVPPPDLVAWAGRFGSTQPGCPAQPVRGRQPADEGRFRRLERRAEARTGMTRSSRPDGGPAPARRFGGTVVYSAMIGEREQPLGRRHVLTVPPRLGLECAEEDGRHRSAGRARARARFAVQGWSVGGPCAIAASAAQPRWVTIGCSDRMPSAPAESIASLQWRRHMET